MNSTTRLYVDPKRVDPDPTFHFGSEPESDPILPNFRGMLWFNQTTIDIETEIFPLSILIYKII